MNTSTPCLRRSLRKNQTNAEQPEWLCTPNPYVMYTHNPPPKLLELLRQFTFVFDDEYWYWQPNKLIEIVKRAPIWTYPQKGLPAEKHKHKIKGKQTTLCPIKK